MLLFSRNNIIKTQPEPLTLRKRDTVPSGKHSVGNFTVQKLYDLQKLYKLNFFSVHGIDIETRKCTCGNLECSAPGKHPVNKGWSTENKDPMRILLNSNNIGLVTGQKVQGQNKYLIIIDFDKENLELKTRLPKTIVTKTGRENGQHFWFLSKKKIPNSVGIIAEKIDVRGAGGFAIAPGSLHSSGVTYTFLDNGATTIAELPEWLETKLTEKVCRYYKQSKDIKNKNLSTTKSTTNDLEIAKLCLKKGVIPTGMRNSVVYRLVLAKRADGYTRTELLKYAKELKNNYCEQPSTFHDSELASIVYNVMKHCKQPFYVNTNLKWFYDRINSKVSVDNDKEFFDKFFVADENGKMTLKEILECREKFHKQKNSKAFIMKGSLAGVALKERGFSKKHTYKGNFWKIKVSSEFAALYDPPMETHPIANQPEETETVEYTLTLKVHPREQFYVKDGTMEKMQATMEKLSIELDTDAEYTENFKNFLKQTIKPNDIIGFDEGVYVVEQQSETKIPYLLKLKSVKTSEQLKPTLEDLFDAYKIGFLEILYRDDKPYGVELHKKISLKIRQTKQDNVP